MEFHISISGPVPDPGCIEEAIRMLDPSALVDVDPASPTLRIATSLGVRELVEALAQAGHAVPPGQVRQLPSICCGGCSG